MTKEQISEFKSRITNSNHSGLALVLLDMEEVYINDVLQSFAKEKVLNENNEEVVVSKDGDYFSNLEKASKVHNELLDMVDKKDETGKVVWKMIHDTKQCYIKSTENGAPYYLEQHLVVIEIIRGIFRNIHSIDTDPPVMRDAARIFAGLTYGKGTLNECVDEGYSGRDFRV